jgi:hypothetical protein
MGEFGTVRRRVQSCRLLFFSHFLCIFYHQGNPSLAEKKGEKHLKSSTFFEPACNRSIVPPAHFTLCPKLDIHGTDLSYTLQKVAETPWKVMERSGTFLSIQYLINLVRSTWIGRDGTSGNILENRRTTSSYFELYPQICNLVAERIQRLVNRLCYTACA